MDTIYDNSQLQAFKNCPEQYRLKYVEKLRKREEGRDEHHANFGSAIHAGLECLYKGDTWVQIEGAFTDAYPKQLDTNDLSKTQQNGLLLLKHYNERYREEDKRFEILGVELNDTFDLGSVRFRVKIDLVVRDKDTGSIYFMDHKTTGKSITGQGSYYYWQQFEPNSQITAYTAYCVAKYGECSGGIINSLSFKWLKKCQKLSDSPDPNYSINELKFSKFYKKNMYNNHGFTADFVRQVFNRSELQVDAWKCDAEDWVKEVELYKPHAAEWRKNEGGCLFCPYKEACIACADPNTIEALYEECDPFDYLKENKVG